MSATNRGSTRKPHDFYPTPISTIETFLDVFPLRLIFLLRTAFMESDQRFEFWQQEDHRLAGLYTLHKRPSFTGHGTDATSYSWFVWQPGSSHQTIKII